MVRRGTHFLGVTCKGQSQVCPSPVAAQCPGSMTWRRAEHVLPGCRRKQQLMQQRHHHRQSQQLCPSWKRKFPASEPSWPRVRIPVGTVDLKGPVLKRQCRREEFVPQCDEEMEEWLAGRHADLQTALATGQLLEVARLSQLMTTAAEEWHQLIQNQRTAPSALANTAR